MTHLGTRCIVTVAYGEVADLPIRTGLGRSHGEQQAKGGLEQLLLITRGLTTPRCPEDELRLP
jgi:hypothetical protein